MKLRPYQLDALNAVKAKYQAGVTKQLMVAPTGVGKTCIFSALPDHLGIKNRVLVLVHREELAEQACDKILKWNPQERVGIEMATSRAHDNRVVVASVQTLGRLGTERLEQFKPEDFGLIITDEAHHATAQSYRNIYTHFGVLANHSANPGGKGSHILHLGVTATPNRADGEGLHEIYDEITYSMSILDAIKDGWLANIRGYRVSTCQSLDGVHTRAGDFASDELSNAVNNAERNQLVVKHWLEIAKDRPTLVFCVDIAHAKEMANEFKRRGINADAVWGEDTERTSKLHRLSEGKLSVLCNCAVLTEGYDDWHISCIVMARPTKSQLLFVQCSGRGTRIPTDVENLLLSRKLGDKIEKEDCVLIDVVDSTTKHSLVTLPSLFGMGERMDMKGRTITAALEHFNNVQQQHPNADLSAASDLTKLNSYATSVDLFSIKWVNEILEADSKLQWHPAVGGGYNLYLPHDNHLFVKEDLLQKWNISGKIGLNKIEDHGIRDLPEALRMSEEYVRLMCPEDITLVRREARWHHENASDAQINLLKKFRIPIPSNLTKGAAQLAIAKLLKRKV